MATRQTATNRQLKESEDSARCSICREIFNDPRNLSCSHSFCLACLQNIQQGSEAKPCPICQKETIPSVDELASLKLNVFAAQLIELIKEHHQSAAPEQEPIPMSDNTLGETGHDEPDEQTNDAELSLALSSNASCMISTGTSESDISSGEVQDHILTMMGILNPPEGGEQSQLSEGTTIQQAVSEFEEAQASMLSQIQTPENFRPEASETGATSAPRELDDSETATDSESTLNALSLANVSHQTLRPSMDRMDILTNNEHAMHRSEMERVEAQAAAESVEVKEGLELEAIPGNHPEIEQDLEMEFPEEEPKPPKIVACAACSTEDFDVDGVHYRCGICEDYDLCLNCFEDISSLHKETHLFVQVKSFSSSKKKAEPILDRLETMRLGISMKMGSTEHDIPCNGCQAKPIQGIRFKCGCCLNFELCENCVLKSSEIHDPHHSFIRIPHKATYDVSFRTLQVRLLYV